MEKMGNCPFLARSWVVTKMDQMVTGGGHRVDWEAAFFQQYQDACVGRLLRGIIHNLNGVNQAFSLQAALFRSMFVQAEGMLSAAELACGPAAESLSLLRGLLRKRLMMVGQMEEKVEEGQRIVARVLPLSQRYGDGHGDPVSLDTIVALEIEILNADTFFKHSLKKTVSIAPDIPPLQRWFGELHTLCFVLLDNSLNSLRAVSTPSLSITAYVEGGSLLLAVRDSGVGIEKDLAGQIFEPFFTTRAGATGVGLYLAKQMVTAIGGSLDFVSRPGDTCFTAMIPLVKVV